MEITGNILYQYFLQSTIEMKIIHSLLKQEDTGMYINNDVHGLQCIVLRLCTVRTI